MRILIAGCAGFIGRHLAERLLAEDHEVIGIDNLSSGLRSNIDALRARPRFHFIEHDITKPLTVEPRCAQVYDLACPASPADFERLALEILAVCSRGVENLLQLAYAHGARLLHTSTSEVYGDPQEHPQRESYWGHVNPIGPRSCYDEGKRFAESLITAFARRHGLPVRIARIFNTYGPHMRADDGRMLPTFIAQALRGAPLTIHGDGEQTRSFCYVTDMVDGLVRLMASDVTEPVNLGNPVEITVTAAAREVVALAGSSSPLGHTPPVPDDPHIRRPDITRARKLLGWEPRVGWQAGFAETITWFRTQPPPSQAGTTAVDE
ncbi:MAG: SDR family oxidoreductase [Phycisphaerales bacterium]|nr:SDR family oxidoreductase [Phycisphaerales bacterium]